MANIKRKVFDASPKQDEFIAAVLSGKYTFLVFGGAIRGGKTFVALAIAILLCKIYPRSRWTIVRQSLKRLKDNTRPSLDKFLEGAEVTINEQAQTFMFKNGSVIIFKGENFDRDKTLESFKGHETNGFILEEASELREQTFNKCTERAGSYVIQPEPKAGQPPPITIATCNPTQTWIKQKVYDPWKAGKLPKHVYYLPSYVTDNPHLSKAYVDNLKTLPLYEYEVFVKGNWDITIKTSNAFWHQIDVSKHITGVVYDPSTTIHISIDANTMPYCSATLWQVDVNGKRTMQFDEVAARPSFKDKNGEVIPDNNWAGGLAKEVVKKLKYYDYDDIVMIYGDASTKNQNTIDEKKRSFFQIFIEALQEHFNTIDNIARANPQIVKTGEFGNALYAGYDGWEMIIGENCKESISDYLTVQKDMDGTMKKKKITDENGNTYEQYGHMSDTKRYFLYKALQEVYHKWDNRHSTPIEPVVIDVYEDEVELF